jgi:hypothetical protein
MHFLLEIKKYLAGEVTPEAFAETIKCLVDQHGIVIPLNDTPIGGWVRPAGEGRPIKQVRFCPLTHPNSEPTTVGETQRLRQRERERERERLAIAIVLAFVSLHVK